MSDLHEILVEALPPAPALDMVAVAARGRTLTRRRVLLRAAGAAVLGGTAVTTLLMVVPFQEDDRLTPVPATAPSSAITAGPSPSANTRTVLLSFGGCGDLRGVERRVPTKAGPAEVLSLLLEGPTDQERVQQGARTVLGPSTAGTLRSVHLSDGNAYVDLSSRILESVVPSNCGADDLDQVEVTLRNQVAVSEVYFAVDGDPRALVEAMGGQCPDPVEPGGSCDPKPFAD